MQSATIALVMSLLAGLALAEEPADTSVAETAAQAEAKAATAEATRKEAVVEVKEFKPPSGFVTRKRGKLVMYCIKDSTVGTRFKTEKCYDEAQLRDYILSREQNNRDFDRARSTCSNPAACGGG